MPIYAYKCDSCGFAKDVLQKMSDAPLVTCPACEKTSFKKQVTAAGFQLKGSGWYATDFKGGAAAPAAASASSEADKGDTAAAVAVPGAAKQDAAPAASATPSAASTPPTA